VATPVILKLLVAAVPEVPEMKSSPKGLVEVPRLTMPALAGARWSPSPIATLSRFDNEVLAQLEQLDTARSMFPLVAFVMVTELSLLVRRAML
jgi:hypothetical protein